MRVFRGGFGFLLVASMVVACAGGDGDPRRAKGEGSSLLAAIFGYGPRVSRADAGEAIDVSGYWNDEDSRLVSEEMIADSMRRLWIDDWLGATGEQPTVIVGAVRNRSSEQINTRTFVNDLEREFVNDRRVRVVASSDERAGMRAERLDQLRNATMETQKRMGREIGADFMLIGRIDLIVDAGDAEAVRYYQVELELIALESNEKVWVGQKKIKKAVERNRWGD